MKVLLTGAAGFLGQRIASSLLAEGVTELRLHVRQRLPAGMLESLRERHPQARIEVAAANLLARGSLGDLVAGVDCIVHAAAGMRGGAADMFANTVIGTRNLLEESVARKTRRIILISSFSVYCSEGVQRGNLLSESTPIEKVGSNKGAYGYAKTRQEQMFLEFQREHHFESAILRPGVIYGEASGALSPRVGIKALGVFFSLGGGATLPLTYVDNCADAVARVTVHAPSGAAFNVVDDDLPRCRNYLGAYRRLVQPMRTLPVPYWAFLLGAKALERYHRKSKGQLPAVFTPYVVRSMYRPIRYSNEALKSIGWTQRVSTSEALARSMRAWHAKVQAARSTG